MQDLPVQSRLRVLVIAELCNPEWNSVPLVGWSHAEALSRVAEIHVVTSQRNAPALERAGWVHGRDYTALATETLGGPAERLVTWLTGAGKGWSLRTALGIPSYLLFEHRLWRHFRRDIEAGRFDIVHRLTPLSPSIPSLIAGRCRRAGVAFVIGPLNGGLAWPAEYPDLRRRESDRLARLRSAYRLLPWYRATRRAARAIVVGSASALRDLPKRWHDRAVYIPENGIDPGRFAMPARRAPGLPLRAVFIGRLIAYKGADMVLEAAAAHLAAGRMTLDIIGEGPERAALEALVVRLGIEHAVAFAGHIPHREVASRIRHAHVLTFPSLREFGGGVVLEAMAVGCVPIVVDYGGPGEMVTPRTGFALKLAPRAALVAALRATIDAIVADPARLTGLSERAAARARECFSWSAKAEQMVAVYRWALDPTLAKPGTRIPYPDVVEIPPAPARRDAALTA